MSEKGYSVFVKLSRLIEYWIQKGCVKTISILSAKDN